MRAAEPGDLAALLELYGELTEGTPSAAPGDADTARVALQEVLAQTGRHLLVALHEEHVVGTADLVIVPNITHHGTA